MCIRGVIVKYRLSSGHLITPGVRTISVENVLKVTPTLHNNLATMIKMQFLLCSIDTIRIGKRSYSMVQNNEGYHTCPREASPLMRQKFLLERHVLLWEMVKNLQV